MEAHTERMERFEEAIYKQREEINEKIIEIFSLLKEFTKGKSPEKVLVREEVNKPVTKYINVVSLVRIENDKDQGGNEVVDKSIVEPIKPIENEEVTDDVMDNESDTSMSKDSTRWGKYMEKLMEMPRSQLIGYYLKHDVNEKQLRIL
ncbi:hypothetical protein Tco_1312237 [Tanacetum coccineum]